MARLAFFFVGIQMSGEGSNPSAEQDPELIEAGVHASGKRGTQWQEGAMEPRIVHLERGLYMCSFISFRC